MQNIKKWFVFVLCLGAVSVYAQFTIPEKPKLQTSVYDAANLLSSSQKQELEQKLISYADSTSTQIVVATVATIKGEDIGLLTPRWAQKWGIGQAEKDNGVFVLVAEKERKIWISPGYEAEIKLTAGILGTIVRRVILPEFKKGDYYRGLDNGTTAIMQVLTGTFKNDATAKKEEFPVEVLLFLIIFVILIILAINSRNNSGRKGKKLRKRSVAEDIFDTIILSGAGRSSGGFGSGHSSGGGFGGFGGGFGGGGFSGGGAGGSW